ncbi:hypothetical protein D3C75_1043940 [compost metagenome]
MPCLSSSFLAVSAITTAFGSPSLMIRPSFLTFGNCSEMNVIRRVVASGLVSEAPDTLPPGCSRSVTILASIGSVTAANRTGVSLPPACTKACAEGVAIPSTRSFLSAAIFWAMDRLLEASAWAFSRSTFRFSPSTIPASFSAARNPSLVASSEGCSTYWEMAIL